MVSVIPFDPNLVGGLIWDSPLSQTRNIVHFATGTTPNLTNATWWTTVASGTAGSSSSPNTPPSGLPQPFFWTSGTPAVQGTPVSLPIPATPPIPVQNTLVYNSAGSIVV